MGCLDFLADRALVTSARPLMEENISACKRGMQKYVKQVQKEMEHNRTR
jgi:hypothetical protein